MFCCAHADRKLSSTNLFGFGDSNTAILKQSNNVNNKQFAVAGRCCHRCQRLPVARCYWLTRHVAHSKESYLFKVATVISISSKVATVISISRTAVCCVTDFFIQSLDTVWHKQLIEAACQECPQHCRLEKYLHDASNPTQQLNSKMLWVCCCASLPPGLNANLVSQQNVGAQVQTGKYSNQATPDAGCCCEFSSFLTAS